MPSGGPQALKIALDLFYKNLRNSMTTYIHLLSTLINCLSSAWHDGNLAEDSVLNGIQS